MTLTHRRYINVTGVTETLQNSTDLNAWTTVTGQTPTVVGTDAITGDPIVQLAAPMTAARQFIRLNVVANP